MPPKTSGPTRPGTERDISEFRRPNPANPRTTPQAGPRPQFYVPLSIAFYICLLSHVLAAAYAPVQDCDEVFNYWEPTHYLTHGYGLQTWEYSPEFAIRSWLYIGLHAAPQKLASFFAMHKSFEFYFLRIILAAVCAASEIRLYSAISRTLNPRIGILYLIIIAFTPGMFYASVAYLPSSFAMYCSTFGLAAFMDWTRGPRTASGIMWFGIGAVLGWPFAGVLVAPFVLEEVVVALVTGDSWETFRRVLDGTVRSLIFVAFDLAINAFFYHKPIISAWQIVFYNVFSGSDQGPDIFGTEPWDFYARNLLLNFNIWFLLAVLSAPLLVLQWRFRAQATTKQTVLRTVVFITPLYLWIFIFNLQAHKEERFMYPAYPFLALNAAIALHMILAYLGSSNPKEFIGRVPASIKFAVIFLGVLLSVNIGLLRIVGTVTAYRAPLEVYRALETPGLARPGETVCLGKEWYRFPSSYFLPKKLHAKFIKSDFDGLLPGEFNEAKIGFGIFPGTWLIPPGMNDRNEEDPGKHFDLKHCTYLVDSYMPGSNTSKLEPSFILDDEAWEEVSCSRFLDTTSTGFIPRMIWIPDLPFIPSNLRRHWGDYCLLRRR